MVITASMGTYLSKRKHRKSAKKKPVEAFAAAAPAAAAAATAAAAAADPVISNSDAPLKPISTSCGPIDIVKPRDESERWMQLAGHPDSFIASGENTILKQQPGLNSPEILVYRVLASDPQMGSCIPKFYREVDNNDKKYIELEDLLRHFNQPNAIDIKLGTRTFQECEVDQQVLRPDLYEKMANLDPKVLTDLEHQQKAVTKLRYMKFRETESSTATFGFRIEGVKMSNGLSHNPESLKRIKTKSQIIETISTFVANDARLSKRFSERLTEIRTSFERSEPFKTMEVIGSSLLLLYDETKADIWMIDFGKTRQVGHVVNHRLPWAMGNHEDGYLIGLDNLIQIMNEITEMQIIEKIDSS